MKRFFLSGAGAAVLWVLASMMLAAILTPWFYRWGTALAQAAETSDLAVFLEWLGAACGRATYGRYFSRALAFSALLMLPLVCRRVRHLADGADVEETKIPLRSGLLQVLAGFAIAGFLLWAMGLVLNGAGVYEIRSVDRRFDLIGRVLAPAAIASLLEEWLFRGVLLGLWLRYAKPMQACVGTSAVFAFIHFLNPPDGAVIADPGSPLAGFLLLGTVVRHFAEPLFFVTDFATLFGIGMILAWARLRTGALWFSIGLHAGWIAAFKAFSLAFRGVPGHPLRPWGVGNSLREGLLPLLMLLVTAAVCHFAMRKFADRRECC